MGFVDSIKGWFAPVVKSSPYAGGNAVIAPFLDVWDKTPAPSAMQLVKEALGTAYACGTLNSELVASTNPRLYVRTTRKAPKSRLMDRGDTRALTKANHKRLSGVSTVSKMVDQAKDVREVLSHPVLDLLEQPNDAQQDGVGMSRHGLLEITQRYLEFVGRCYWWPEREGAGGNPSAIWVLAPQYMREVIGTGPESRLIEKYSFSGSGAQDYEPDEIVPFRMPDLATGGYTGGFSPLRAAFEQVRIFRMYAAYVNALLRNSGKPSAMWSPSGTDAAASSISPVEAQRMRSAFRQQFAMAGAGGVMVSEIPGTLEPFSWKTEEMLSEKAGVAIKTMIANCFSVPTTKLDRNDANLASSRTGDYAHAKDAGLPRLRRMEAALNSFLLPMYGDKDRQLFFAFDDPEGLTDPVFELEQQKSASEIGAVTRNEIRASLDLEPEPWGDTPLVSNTMVAVDLKTGLPQAAPIGVDPNKPQDDGTDEPTPPSEPQNVPEGTTLSTGILALQTAYHAGEIERTAAIENAVLSFKLGKDEATALFPDKPPDPPKTAEQRANEEAERQAKLRPPASASNGKHLSPRVAKAGRRLFGIEGN